jgi:hypothetical protein
LSGGLIFSGETIGWICWSFLALPALVLICQAIADAITSWRWRRAHKRGEIKSHPFRERIKAEYLGRQTESGA